MSEKISLSIAEKLLQFSENRSPYKTITCPKCEHIYLETEGGVAIEDGEVISLCPKCEQCEPII